MRHTLRQDIECDYVVGPARKHGRGWQLIDPIRVTRLPVAFTIMEKIRPPAGRAQLWRGGQIVACMNKHAIWRHSNTANPPAHSPVAPTAGSTRP